MQSTIRFFESASVVLGRPADERAALISVPLRVLGQAKAVLGAWAERIESRRQLLELDERMLSDIGLDRATVIREASKPFWKA